MKKTIIIIAITAAVVFILSFLLLKTSTKEEGSDKPKETQLEMFNSGRVSGVIMFNSLKPNPGDKGEISILFRENEKNIDFEMADLDIKPDLVDGTAWSWSGAQDNKTYDLVAVLNIEGKEIIRSPIVTVTAPAENINLVLSVSWSKLPLVSKEESVRTLSGNVYISGYIPNGATVSILTAPARDNSEISPVDIIDPHFSLARGNLKAKQAFSWDWKKALSRIDYEIEAELYDSSGKSIGSSNIVRAVVPQKDIRLDIKSEAKSAKKEDKTVDISGKVSLHGGYKSDSIIRIEARKNETGGFSEIASFSARSENDWKYKNAEEGMPYEIRAVLETKGKETTVSKRQNVIAPAAYINLTINTDLDLDDPKSKPDIVDCDKRDDGGYNARISFRGVKDARIYWLSIGKQKHSGDRFYEAEKPDNTGDEVDVKIKIDKGRYYYAEYAYSYCRDCDQNLDSYSDFSPVLKFYCGKKPD